MADLEQGQTDAAWKTILSRGARWQLGLAVLVTLVWVALFITASWSGSVPTIHFVLADIPFLPVHFVAMVVARSIYLLVASVSDDYFMESAMNALVIVGACAAVFGVYFVLLVPLRLWIDRPGQRTRWAILGVVVALVYVLAVTLLFLGVGGAWNGPREHLQAVPSRPSEAIEVADSSAVPGGLPLHQTASNPARACPTADLVGVRLTVQEGACLAVPPVSG